MKVTTVTSTPASASTPLALLNPFDFNAILRNFMNPPATNNSVTTTSIFQSAAQTGGVMAGTRNAIQGGAFQQELQMGQQ